MQVLISNETFAETSFDTSVIYEAILRYCDIKTARRELNDRSPTQHRAECTSDAPYTVVSLIYNIFRHVRRKNSVHGEYIIVNIGENEEISVITKDKNSVSSGAEMTWVGAEMTWAETSRNRLIDYVQSPL